MIGYASVPVELDRDEARELAREELSQPGYDRDVAWPARALEWLLEQLNRLVAGAADAIPGGLATAATLGAVVTIAVLIIVRTGPLARRKTAGGPVFTGRRRTAAAHRAAADAAARAEDWSTAVLERFRAVVAQLEERAVIADSSGLTADEISQAAAARLPSAAPLLTAGAVLFDEVLYGGRVATRDGDDAMRLLDDAVRHARPQAPGDTMPSLAAPR